MTATLIIAVRDPNICYLLQRYAEESGFRAVGVSRGADALAQLAEQPTLALLILGADLPDARRDQIKAAACSLRIPVLIYSCVDEPVVELPEGVTGYLPRSVMYDDFVAELTRAGLLVGACASKN